MSCPDQIIYHLEDTFEGCTFSGFTVSLTSDAEDTEFSAALSLAVFRLKDSVSGDELTLSSANAGEITLESTASNAWSITVEPRIVNLTAGTYSFAIITTDAGGFKLPLMQGTLRIHPSPLS